MEKERVFLAGASGSMGFEAFRILWQKRQKYDIVLLQRPSKKNKNLFKKYEKLAGITPILGSGIVEGEGLKIIWGDATNYEDIVRACENIVVSYGIYLTRCRSQSRNGEASEHRCNKKYYQSN